METNSPERGDVLPQALRAAVAGFVSEQVARELERAIQASGQAVARNVQSGSVAGQLVRRAAPLARFHPSRLVVREMVRLGLDYAYRQHLARVASVPRQRAAAEEGGAFAIQEGLQKFGGPGWREVTSEWWTPAEPAQRKAGHYPPNEFDLGDVAWDGVWRISNDWRFNPYLVAPSYWDANAAVPPATIVSTTGKPNGARGDQVRVIPSGVFMEAGGFYWHIPARVFARDSGGVEADFDAVGAERETTPLPLQVAPLPVFIPWDAPHTQDLDAYWPQSIPAADGKSAVRPWWPDQPMRIGWREAALRKSNEWPQGYERRYKVPNRDAEAEAVARAKGERITRNPSNTPYPRRHEKKLTVKGPGATVVGAILEHALERKDDLDALWFALHPSIRKAYRNEWVKGEFERGVMRPNRQPPEWVKAQAVWEQRHLIDKEGAVRELVWARVEDMLYGLASKPTDRATKSVERSRRGTFSPDRDFQHWADAPSALVAQYANLLEERITGRQERAERGWENPAIREFALADALKRRRDMKATIRRKLAYRRRQRAGG